MHDAINQFLKSIQYERQLSPHTINSYKVDLLSAAEFFATEQIINWQAIEENHIRALLVFKRNQKISPRSINRQLSTLRTFYRYLIREGVLTENKPMRITALKVSYPLPKALEVDQMSKLLNAPPTNTVFLIRDIALIELMYSAGLRVSEVVALNVEHLDLNQQQASVTGKGNKSRIALIGRFADKALKEWLIHRKQLTAANEKALFLNKYGKRISTRAVNYRLYEMGIKQGLGSRLHSHRLRHSFASHLLESSLDLRAVQELLGHADLSSTQIYTKLNFQHLATVYDQCHPRAHKQKGKPL